MNYQIAPSTHPERVREASVHAVEEGLTAEVVDGDTVRAEVERIVALEDDARYRAEVSAFLAEHRTHWRRMAVHLCRANAVPTARFLDDVDAIVTATAWEMLERSRQDPGYLRTMRSFLAIVVYTARPKVRSFVDHATAPASGMVAAQRRRRELARTRSELAALRGTAPSVEEAVRATNERLGAHRADVVRQGMVVSEADELVMRGALPFDDALDADTHVDDDPDCVLHPVEVPALLRSVVDAARAEHPARGRVAALWMSEAYGGGGPLPGQDTVVWISRTLGLPRRRTLAHIERVRELAVEQLRTMGIDVGALEHA
ncbi:hypothetical protein [Cellulosimicrobium sp. CUA-896]|uniref:hypothetical protein n=1 Tax=Cellulosimicrobium sp. CUA-896 TaxID=1517881 RepID=UPI00096A5A53|nr:hypothetical protein [Cellulosimicrobium sp. CUA-896]